MAELPFPDFDQDYEFVNFSPPGEYPMNHGRIVPNRGLDIDVADYEKHFEKEHVPYTNALHSVHKGHGASFVRLIKEINLAYTPEARVNDYVLVHVGFAITTIDEAEAERVFRYLDELGEVE